MSHLTQRKCVPCEGGVPPITGDELQKFLLEVPEWEIVDDENTKIGRTFSFKNFHQTMDFVNKVAAIANEENHHPDMHVHYSKVTVELWTHAIGGLSENDFIVAAKIDAL